MSDRAGIEDLLRDSAPQVLAALVRRYGNFADAEDAVQEALLAAASQWPAEGGPENPVGWLVQVASRRMIDQVRAERSRVQREESSAWDRPAGADDAADYDDTLVLMLMCCHPALTAGSAIALTLRAVGGLNTGEIARAFLVPEATMAQRISRAKQTIKRSGIPFAMPDGPEWAPRLASVLHVLYLIFNEGYLTSSGGELARTDLSGEAIRLRRMVRRALPGDPEVIGLLALMLLTEARRPARADAGGRLVPLAEQDRTRWNQELIAEGDALIGQAWGKGPIGQYQVQAAIAALHDQAADPADTDWREILALYELLERMTGNPLVSLNRAIAAAMADGPVGRPRAHRAARAGAGRPPPAARGSRPPARAGRTAAAGDRRLRDRGRANREPARAALPDDPRRTAQARRVLTRSGALSWGRRSRPARSASCACSRLPA